MTKNRLMWIAGSFVLATSLVGCATVVGLGASPVETSAFSEGPFVAVAWPELVLDLTQTTVSSFAIKPLARREDRNTLVIRGRFVAPNAATYPAVARINLEKLGFAQRDAENLRVYWQNRHGERVELKRKLETSPP